MNLQTLLDYSSLFRARLRVALADATPEQWTREFPKIGHTTLRDTLVHMVAVEDEWVQIDILGQSVDESVYAGARYPDAAAVFDQWARVRSRTLALIAERGPDGLERPIELFGEGGISRGFFRIEDVLLHVLFHEIGHRGDVTTLMTLADLPVPGLDHLGLLRWSRKP